MQDEFNDSEVSVLGNSVTSDNKNSVDSIPVIHWTQTTKWRTPTFNIKPELPMLVEGGKQILRQHSIMRMRQCVGKETYWVTYDRAYVVEYLANEVLKPLFSLPYNELQKLLSDAMKSLKSQEDNGLIKRKSKYSRDID